MTNWVYLQRKTHCYLTPFIEVIGKVYASSGKKVWFGKSFENFFVVYTNGVMTWYGNKDKIDELYTSVSLKMMKQPEKLNDLYTQFKIEIKKLMQLSEHINTASLNKLSSDELWKLYEDYIKLYEVATIYGEPVPLVTKDVVLEHIKKTITDNEAIRVLSTPEQRSFIAREQEELESIAAVIREDNTLLRLFEEHTPTELLEKLKDHSLYARIQKHWEKYCWIPYDYGVQIWQMSHFVSSLKAILKKEPVITQHLKKMQEEYKKKYPVSGETDKLFEYIKLATYMMDYKKELFTKSHYLVSPLIHEIARRFGTTDILVRFMQHEEMKDGLIKSKIVPVTELQRRHDLSVCLWDSNGNTSYVPEEQTKKFITSHIQENPELDKSVKLHGTCACVGKYTGAAKIVLSSTHITKVEKGDVLIAPMTSPDYVIGMKKAGAIVTDEGGITCHAAIVSRELRVPCVVGTGRATKVFKDGDLVEVNAHHASIKLIKKRT